MAGARVLEAQFLPEAQFRDASFGECFRRPLRNVGVLITGAKFAVADAILWFWIR